MSSKTKETQPEESLPQTILADFLESHPPGQLVEITDLATQTYNGRTVIYSLNLPELRLHCNNDRCNGMRVFRSKSKFGPGLTPDEFQNEFIIYTCSNCQRLHKTYSLAIQLSQDLETGKCCKYGEIPIFGPSTPSRLIRLFGPDREEFLKGRRCENQGLGIGAFTYYRRVVENQKNRILEEIKRVVQKVNPKQELIAAFDSAISETQFQKAISIAKDGIPESLFINGHNPLGLLHSALSEGVHELTDAQCLELAESIRIVLTEFSERLGQALKDEAQLTGAVSKLLNRKK